jgi:DNA-binding response OmpR family regulator
MEAVILLIDDDDNFSNSIQRYFTQEGINLERARTWDEGVSKFRLGLHELVIADYHLPGSKHGLRLLAEIKPLHPSSELILISGAITSVKEDQIKVSGLVNKFLRKTARLPEILLEMAKGASARASNKSDWDVIAKAYIAGDEVDITELDRLDKLLNVDVEGTQP